MDSIKKICYLVLIFLFLIIGSDFHIFAQSGLQMSVSGRIREFNTHRPLAGVKIEVCRFENEKITDVKRSKSSRNGYFKIRFLDAGQYRLSIDIPEIGGLHIDSIASYGMIGKDNYKFEVKDGQNVVINVFLGEYQFPYIQRKDSFDKNRIEITMFYTNEMKQGLLYAGENQQRQEKMLQDEDINMPTASLSSSSPCPGLHFNYWCPIITLPDDFPLSFEDDVGGKIMLYSDMKNLGYLCKNDQCNFDDFILEGGAIIVLRRPQWFDMHYNCPGPGQDIECGECHHECTKKHELIHWEDFKYSFVTYACRFLEEIRNIPVKCDCEDWVTKCRIKFYEAFYKFKKNYNFYMEGSEDRACDVSDPCHAICNVIN